MRSRREALGITQTELARELRAKGLSFHQQTVQRVEGGERPVRLDEAFLISDALSFPIYSMVKPPEGEIGSMYTAIDRLRRAAARAQEEVLEAESAFADSAEFLAIEFEDLLQRESDRSGAVVRWGAAWMVKARRVQDSLSDTARSLNGITDDSDDDWTEIAVPFPNVAEDFRWIDDEVDPWVHMPETERPEAMADMQPMALYDYVRDYMENWNEQHPEAP
ncbi:hypothetical protein ASF89_08795 [Frigoribacterium sp. Leaf172]|nr:hypothetical protein ASF89_08795 [Frigoribacterium sp. Leaf172]